MKAGISSLILSMHSFIANPLPFAPSEHTLISSPGEWIGTGWYFDHKDGKSPVSGAFRVMHERGVWHLEIGYKVLSPAPFNLSAVFEIIPFIPNEPQTPFWAVSPTLGKFSGTLALCGAQMMTLLEFEDQRFSGNVNFYRVGPEVYQFFGFVLFREKIISSWGVELLLQNNPLI